MPLLLCVNAVENFKFLQYNDNKVFATDNNKKVLIVSSLFIEICQFPQARGTDIDDLWINTLGAIIGYAMYCLFAKTKAKKLFDKFKV